MAYLCGFNLTMAKIKVLHIIKSLGRGGAEMLLPETLRLHDKEKFEFHYIYFLPWKDQMVMSIEEAGGKVTCVSANNNFQLLKKYHEVLQYCDKYDIDIIHCHLPWSAFVGRIIYKKTNKPVIYTEHNIQEKFHFATKYLNKITFNSQSMAIGVSEDVTRSINENIDVRIPVQTVVNGVNTEKFRMDKERGETIKRELNIPSNAVVIGNIAVFRKQKGLEDWVKAFKKITDKEKDVYGVLVGAGTEEEKIKEIIEKYDLSDKLKLPGLQTDTVAYFSAMDIFMMSSLFEGLPIALLEAMSMECAIVSTKAGGVVEAIRNEKDGFLCEVGDHEKLASLTLSLVGNKEKMLQMQKAARERVERNFSLKAMVNTLEQIYLKY